MEIELLVTATTEVQVDVSVTPATDAPMNRCRTMSHSFTNSRLWICEAPIIATMETI